MVVVLAQVNGKQARQRRAPRICVLAGHEQGRFLRWSKDGALRLSRP